jgi:superfamily I DNA and RNA helicase
MYDDAAEKSLSEEQDEIYSLLLSKLAKEKSLVRRQKLLVNMYILTLAPNWRKEYTFEDDDFNAVNKTDSIDGILADIENADNAQYFEMALRSIQSIGTIKKHLTRENVTKDNSRGAILKRLERKISNLDKIQTAAALETTDNVQRIRGLAGSGKTIVLALKAAYLHVAHPDWRIAVTFNTRSLKQQFIDLITRFTFEQIEDTPNWDNIIVIHAWGSPREEGIYYNFCVKHNIEYHDFNYAKSKASINEAFDLVCREAMQSVQDIEKMYDVILVDEAQDFSKDFLQICYNILPKEKRLIYAYDELQSLTLKTMDTPERTFGNDESGTPRVMLKNEPNKPKEDIILQTCYRNSRPVLVTAHALGFRIYGGLIQMFDEPSLWLDIGYELEKGELADDKRAVLKRSSTSSPSFLEDHSPINDLLIFKGFNTGDEQAKWVAQQIYNNLKNDELSFKDILVIHSNPLKTKSEVGPIREALWEMGINSHLAGVTTSPDEFYIDDSITFTSIHRAKGNEAAMVYVVDAQHCGSNYVSAKSRNILFTAITRSRAWVRVLGVGQYMKSIISEYQKVSDSSYKLDFIYPNAAKRKELNIIHRDKSKAVISKIQMNVNNLSDFLLSIDRGEVYWEDVPVEVRQRLKEQLEDE